MYRAQTKRLCVQVFRSSLYIVYMKPFLGVFHYAQLFRKDFSMCVEHTDYRKDVPYGAVVLKDLGCRCLVLSAVLYAVDICFPFLSGHSVVVR